MFLLDIKNKKMKRNLKKNGFIRENFIDEAISSATTFEEVVDVLNAIENPEMLQKKRKEILLRKLIKFSTTYEDVDLVKNYAEGLHYSLTDKQSCLLIEKLVKASTTKYQLKKVKDYARSKGKLSRYMKELFKKNMAEFN